VLVLAVVFEEPDQTSDYDEYMRSATHRALAEDYQRSPSLTTLVRRRVVVSRQEELEVLRHQTGSGDAGG